MEFELQAAIDDRVILDLELGSVEILERMDVAVIAALTGSAEPSRVVFVNDAALRLIGYPREEVIGTAPGFWIAGADEAEAPNPAGETPATTEPTTRTVVAMDSEGREQPLRVRTSTHGGAWGLWTISTLLPLEPTSAPPAGSSQEPCPIEVGPLALDPVTRMLACRRNYVNLTPSECVVLMTLMRRVGSVVDRSSLQHLLWGFQPPRRTRAVDVYAASLRSKLQQIGVSGETIQSVRGVGYILKL